jgi:CHRD domain
MKRAILALALLAAIAIPTSAIGAAKRTFHVHLSGAQEVPKTGSHATGTATFKIARNGRSIHYRLTAHGLHGTPAAAHIHLGRPGVPGGIIIALKVRPFHLPASGVVTKKSFTPVGSVKTFAQAIRAIRAGKTYVNIHTTKFPAGEIRGQIRR